ncbi:MAG TPA: NAD(P)-dependent alcohol dehydrogenase, partial [Micromonospora sp.]
MRAVQLTAPGVLEVVEVPVPVAGPGEVLVGVGAVGACHSDLHILDAPEGAFPTPLTLGHEIAGRIEATGPGVAGWQPGEAVAVYGILACGHCRACLRGLDNQCRTVPFGGLGLSRDGGLADYVVVPARNLLRIGDLDVVQAAPLTDAGLTPYHAIELARPHLRPGTCCVVIGIGGLGHMALQILAATTAVTVIAVDTDPDALQLASRIGAHHVVPAGDDAVDKIRQITGAAPDGADVVLDFVGAKPTLDLARSVVAAGGDLMLVGLAGGELPMRPGLDPTVPMESTVRIPFWGTRADLQEVIALGRTGQVHADIRTFPLADAVKAYEQLRQGE